MRWDNLTANPADSERPADPVDAGHPADHAEAERAAGHAGPAESGRGRAEAAALFGADAVTTRTFDTPEFLSNTHHHATWKGPGHLPGKG